MESITRDDAVLAVKLWGLAQNRYWPTRHTIEEGPQPVTLYAGLRSAGQDPVYVLRQLAIEITELAAEWGEWAHPSRDWDWVRRATAERLDDIEGHPPCQRGR